MIPIKHPHCNAVLARPANMTEKECRDLHIRREDGHVWSFWKPNDEELLALNRGGSVALAVMGETHPPLSVMVARPFEPFDRAPTEAEYRHRMGAVNGRMSALMDITKRIVAGWVRESNDSPRRQHLVNQFLDLINLNRADGEIVEGMPQPEPEQTTTANDAERYRADAEGWKAEAERWRILSEAKQMDVDRLEAELGEAARSNATDGQRTTDAGGWMNYCLEAEQELAKARDAIRLLSTTVQELDAVMNPNPAEP